MGTLWWIWKAPDEPADTRQDASMKLINKVTADVSIYQCSLEVFALVGICRFFFFLAQIIFFSPSRVAFGVLR